VEERKRDFGRHLHRIRTEVFQESLREFSKRIKLSPSYIGKLENAEVATPRRSTVIDIAERLQMDPDPLLVKAGFVPPEQQRGGDDEYLLMLFRTLTPGQQAAVREYIKHVQTAGIEKI
jgi:transcriptional regulator with XRE-family HTH domain